MIPMTMADIIDRWTIALVKKHVGKLDMDAEIKLYEGETLAFRLEHPNLFADWFDQLLIHNSRVWVFESEIRNAVCSDSAALNSSEIVRRALMTREGNKDRCAVKQKVSEALDETKDVKADTLASPAHG